MATGTVQDWITNLSDYGLGDDITTDDLLSIINDVIQDVNSRQLWSFLQTTSTFTLTSGTALVSLPARFNKVQGMTVDSLGTTIRPERRETIVKRYTGSLTATGSPVYYYFIGTSMYVYPIPDQAYTVVLDYYQDEVTVTAATVLTALLLPVKHQDAYFLGTLSRLFALEDDSENAMHFAQLQEAKIVNMMDDLTMHEVDMPDHMIDVWDDGPWA